MLDAATRASVIAKGLLIRRTEERLLSLLRAGELGGTVHTCIGQEMAAATIGEFVQPGDSVFSNHRGHGHYLAITGDVRGLVAEVMGRETGACGGRGGTQHLHRDGFSSSGILGGALPIAAGVALAHQLDRDGQIALAFIGDGAFGQGVVYESLNIAARWQLPLLVVVEDNRYAQSTPRDDGLAGTIEARAGAFGIPVAHADTWDWQALADTAREAIRATRDGGGPRMLVIDTYRLEAHSKGDDLRPREEVQRFIEIDPLNRLLCPGHEQAAALDATARCLVDDAVAFARSSAPPTPEPPPPPARPIEWRPAPAGRPERFVSQLRGAFAHLLDECPRVIFLGEDVRSPYGGAFKVSLGLSEQHPEQVLNTPISEAAIVGLGLGLALRGYRPIVEIMFGDFLTLAMDQLVNHCAKLRAVYGRNVRTDIVIRTPMGGGRGYGATHSQTLDRHFFGIPGLRVVALNTAVLPEDVYRALLAPGAGPTLVIENKLQYGRRPEAPPAGFELLSDGQPLPVIRLCPTVPPVVSLLGYGGMFDSLVEAATTLFDEHDVVAQVLCPTQVYPFELGGLLSALAAAQVLVVAEEGQRFAGFGAEVVAQLAESDVPRPRAIRRVAAVPGPIPASPALEAAMLPSVADIVAAVLEAVRDA